MDQPISLKSSKEKKMKPTIHLDMEEISGLPDIQIGDKIQLKFFVEVTGLHQDSYSDKETTAMDLRVEKSEYMDRTEKVSSDHGSISQ